jgi:competence protein ComEC
VTWHLEVRVVAIAVATAVGAWFGTGPGRGAERLTTAVAGAGAVLAIVGLATLPQRRPRRPAAGMLWLGLGLLVAGVAGVLGQRAVAGLVPPGNGRVRAEVVLVADPAPLPGGGVRAEARYRGKRVALIAFRAAAAGLDDRLSGEIVVVDGVLQPPGRFERRLPHRHLAGRLEVDVVMGWRPGHGVPGAANDVRRSLERGAASLPPRSRSLFLGLVVGDDRYQPPDLTAAFQASGLAHLTAVSGQNVSCALAAAAPLLRRLHLASRLVATLGLLAAFALVTRAEPSVLRATGMAAVAAYGAAVGRPASGVRALGVATAAVLLIDPLLVTSLGFRLSVAGAAGILVGARPLARWLPGPSWLRSPLGVTLAAQLAVAPLLVGAFGTVPAVSVITNLLAAPAAGPVTAWGLGAGLVAGAVGGRVAALLHVPTGLLLRWIETVAVAGAGWPGGQLDLRGVAATTVVLALLLAGRRARVRRRENLADVAPAHP